METDKGVVVAAMTSVGERVSARKTKSGSAEATLCFRESLPQRRRCGILRIARIGSTHIEFGRLQRIC